MKRESFEVFMERLNLELLKLSNLSKFHYGEEVQKRLARYYGVPRHASVRLRAGLRNQKGCGGKSKIYLFYTDIDGGVRLENQLGRFWSWNLADLEVVYKDHVEEALAS